MASQKHWYQVHKDMIKALLECSNLSQKRREFLQDMKQKANPTNNMMCAVVVAFAEQFHRPSKDYKVRAWEDRSAQGPTDQQPAQAAPQQAQPAEPPVAPLAANMAPPAQPTIGTRQNGYVWNGQTWVPEPQAMQPTAAPQPPSCPAPQPQDNDDDGFDF